MPELLKNRYNAQLLHKLATDLQSVYHPFKTDDFIQSIIDDAWECLGLKDRIYKISAGLGRFLPSDYEEAIHILDNIIGNYGTWQNSTGGFFPIFIELYGQEEKYWDISMDAFKRYTPYASCEFAVRPFIIHHEERMMKQMYNWTRDENECVRRLASEGCRPALPWALAIQSFKKNPTPILPILEQLKQDFSIYVQKSVANNLNDISKTHPAIVTRLVKDWYGKDKHTDWIVKHGCRTLLKKGNREVLHLFGYRDDAYIDIVEFKLQKASVSLREDMVFSCTISVRDTTNIRAEYGIDYKKANGKHNRKIYRISETTVKKNQMKSYTVTHSFTDLNTRKYYPGMHTIVLLINGVEHCKSDFELLP